MILTSLRQSAGLLSALGGPEAVAAGPVHHEVDTSLGRFRVDRYEPQSPEPARPPRRLGRLRPAAFADGTGRTERDLPTVIANHGLSPTASDDPRFVKLCRAFAAQGFRVLAPRYATLTRLEITPRTVDEMAAVLGAMERPDVAAELGIAGPVAVFGVSFSASLGLVAAGDPRVRLPISALFCLGGYGDLARTLEGLLRPADAGRPSDDYGRLVFLHHWLGDLVPEGTPALRAWLWRAILDNIADPHKPGAASAAMAAALPADQRAWAARLSDPADPMMRRRCLELVEARRDDIRRMSPVHRPMHADARPTWLMHGRGDAVIPARESRDIETRLRRAGAEVRALYTDAVGHADAAGSGLWMLWEKARTVAFVAGWLRAVHRESRAAARARVAAAVRPAPTRPAPVFARPILPVPAVATVPHVRPAVPLARPAVPRLPALAPSIRPSVAVAAAVAAPPAARRAGSDSGASWSPDTDPVASPLRPVRGSDSGSGEDWSVSEAGLFVERARLGDPADGPDGADLAEVPELAGAAQNC